MEQEGFVPTPTFERVPQELKEIDQWVNYRLENDRKVPVNPKTLGNAGVGWPNTWAPFEKALENFRPGEIGLGFVLTEADPFVCTDLDDCIDDKGQLSLAARAVLDTLQGYVELSPSGQGLHVWVKSDDKVSNWKTKGIEVYSSARWMTVTGRANPKVASDIPERTEELQKILASYFGRDDSPKFVRAEAPVDDTVLWEKLFNAKRGDFFKSLYAGDISVCQSDHSRAVIMLANQLAIMTDGDAERMKRLLLQTGLVDDKWFTKRGTETWIDYQIRDAIRYTSLRRR
jgi:putative DNA primase/helicase